MLGKVYNKITCMSKSLYKTVLVNAVGNVILGTKLLMHVVIYSITMSMLLHYISHFPSHFLSQVIR